MKKEYLEKEFEKIDEMTPEEFAENYLKDTVFPAARNEEEAIYIVTHNGADDESDAPNAIKWYNNIMNEFCWDNGIDRDADTQTLFQIVGWESGITYSADIEVSFKTKQSAEKFAGFIRENLLHTMPTVNFESEFPREQYFNMDDETVVVPERSPRDPYSVHWYVDVRDDLKNRRY